MIDKKDTIENSLKTELKFQWKKLKTIERECSVIIYFKEM